MGDGLIQSSSHVDSRMDGEYSDEDMVLSRLRRKEPPPWQSAWTVCMLGEVG